MYSDTELQMKKVIAGAASLMTSMYKKKKVPLTKYNIPRESIDKKSISKESIDGFFYDDCNILLIDKQIKNMLSNPQDTFELTGRIEEIKLELQKPHTLIKDKILKVEMKSLQLKIEENLNSLKLKKYIEETEKIIDDYRRLREAATVIIDVGENIKGSINETDESYEERMRLITLFLHIAEKYVKLNIRRVTQKNNICGICGSEYSYTDDFYYCPICCTQFPKIKEMTTEKDQKGYESRLNFIKSFNKLQGKDSIIPPGLYDQLDDFCIKNKIPTSAEIKSMKLNTDGTRGSVNLDLLQFILRKTKNKTQYENISLISHEYWGWTLYSDLDEYKEKIMEEYEMLEDALLSIKDCEESSPSVQYKLYRLLLQSYPECNKSHFRLPKDTGNLESKTFKAYTILGWKFDPLTI